VRSFVDATSQPSSSGGGYKARTGFCSEAV
jgi:hypothetical protein